MANITFKTNIVPNSSSSPTLGSSTCPWYVYVTKINDVGNNKGDMLYWSSANTPTCLPIGTSGQVLQVSNSGLPAWATISSNYSVATSTSAGLMSAEDKTILDNLSDNIDDAIEVALSNLTLSDLTDITATAAEVNVLDGITATTTELNYTDGVTSNIQTQLNNKAASSHTHSSYANQNAFSNIVTGSTTVSADTTTDTFTFTAGSNITLTPDATNDKITIAATNTTYSNATTSAAGLMSAADKTKLDGFVAASTSTSQLSVGTKNTTTTCTVPAGHSFIVVMMRSNTSNPYWNTIVPLAECSSTKQYAISVYTSTYFTFSCSFNTSTRLLTFVGNGSYDALVYSF